MGVGVGWIHPPFRLRLSSRGSSALTDGVERESWGGLTSSANLLFRGLFTGIITIVQMSHGSLRPLAGDLVGVSSGMWQPGGRGFSSSLTVQGLPGDAG